MKNDLKTVALLGFMSALVWWLGMALYGGTGGFYVGLMLAAALNLVAYFFSDKLALASTRARPVTEEQLPQVYAMVRGLAHRADLPMPRIYLIDEPQPNAFATGRNPKHAVVAVTRGILQMMSPAELEAVLAHELGHVKNRDILISSIAAMLAAALSILARMALWGGRSRDSRGNPLAGIIGLAGMLVAPLAAVLLRTAISRAREFEADVSGADLTGQPLDLASALAKIGQASGRITRKVNPAVSQLFISDPMKALRARDTLGRMFSTHPPVEERIARLQAMAAAKR